VIGTNSSKEIRAALLVMLKGFLRQKRRAGKQKRLRLAKCGLGLAAPVQG